MKKIKAGGKRFGFWSVAGRTSRQFVQIFRFFTIGRGRVKEAANGRLFTMPR
ncbi:hypothetical protein KJ596_04495 [Patescibacteria group bacterium]|nr:hypothetical protein [Patescibacteria group bacterium]MBU1868033.1 hypothetical protein [Patescibacteria group bacterium]